MKWFIVLLGIAGFALGVVGDGAALPIEFDVSGDHSSVEISGVSTMGSTGISAHLMADLDSEDFSLEDGQSHTVEFFQVDVWGGFFGTGTADILATLAFETPDLEVVGSGHGGWLTFFGAVSGGYINWDDGLSKAVALADGRYVDVDFEEICLAGMGSSAIVHATVTAHDAAPVPEPGTMLLLGCGLVCLAGFGRKKFFNK